MAQMYFDSIPINWTLRDSCTMDINPSNSAKQWTMTIYAGDNPKTPAIFNDLIAAFTPGAHTFVDNFGVSHQVYIDGNPSVSDLFHGQYNVDITFAEAGFSEDSGGDDDPLVSGTITIGDTAYTFNAHLSALSIENTPKISSVRGVVNNFIYSTEFNYQYFQYSINIQNWTYGVINISQGTAVSLDFGDYTGLSGLCTGATSFSGKTFSIAWESDG